MSALVVHWKHTLYFLTLGYQGRKVCINVTRVPCGPRFVQTGTSSGLTQDRGTAYEGLMFDSQEAGGTSLCLGAVGVEGRVKGAKVQDQPVTGLLEMVFELGMGH